MIDARAVLSPTRIVVMDDGIRSVVVRTVDDVLADLRTAAGLSGQGRVVLRFGPDGEVEVEGRLEDACWECGESTRDLLGRGEPHDMRWCGSRDVRIACVACDEPILDDGWPHTDPETGGDIHEACCPVCEGGS